MYIRNGNRTQTFRISDWNVTWQFYQISSALCELYHENKHEIHLLGTSESQMVNATKYDCLTLPCSSVSTIYYQYDGRHLSLPYMTLHYIRKWKVNFSWTRMHSSRMCTVRCSSRGVFHTPPEDTPLWTESQTPVKTVLRTVKI